MNACRPLIWLVCLAVLWCGHAKAQEAKARVSLAGKDTAWAGQRMTLVVELLAPGFFASPVNFDLPDPPGMLIVPPSGSPVVNSEEIDGVNYTVQRHELAAFAQRAGEQTIPPISARFQFKRQPLDKAAVAATVKTEPVKFTTKLPPGAEKLGSIISARNLKVVEEWKPEPGKTKAGDAFTRTVTFTAPDVPAMAFPPFPAKPIDGLGIYPKAPEVLDQDNRGSLTGQRRDVITYVCQRAGQFTIPAARLTWFNLDTQKLETIEFPARTFDVAPNPAMASAAPSQTASPARGLWPALLWSAVAMALLGVCFVPARFWLRLAAPWRSVHLAPLNPPGEHQS